MFFYKWVFWLVMSCTYMVHGKVLTDYFGTECKNFFYLNQPPEWNQISETTGANSICQTLNDETHYATLYNVNHKIPIFSAYKLETCLSPNEKRYTFKVEPGLVNVHENYNLNMELLGNLPINLREEVKKTQAVNTDYENTGYDRGHLYPASYTCGTGRNSTYTLTNAAPLDSCFNQDTWKKMEDKVKIVANDFCDGQKYFVTGVYPEDESEPKQIPEVDPKITIPDVMWTAFCCDDKVTKKSFSFAYYAENSPSRLVQFLPVELLNGMLSYHYKSNGIADSIKIFGDPCFYKEGEETLKQALNELKKCASAIRLRSVIGTFEGSQKRTSAETSTSLPLEKSSRIRLADEQVESCTTDTANLWTVIGEPKFQVDAVDIKGIAKLNQLLDNFGQKCVLSKSIHHGLFRDSSEGKDELQCLVEPIKPEKTVTIWNTRCLEEPTYSLDGTYRCKISEKTSHAVCTSSCAPNGQYYYWCYTSLNNKTWDYCSPEYSTITKTGKSCIEGFSCGLNSNKNPFGADTFGCYIDYELNYETCCAPYSNCDKNGWCYVSPREGIFSQNYESCNNFVSHDEHRDDLNETSVNCPDNTIWSVYCTSKSTCFCYKYFGLETHSTWQMAEDTCNKFYSGHLASIHSTEEAEFLDDLADGDIGAQPWIGLRRKDSQSWFSWTDGTELDFEFWAEGEPSVGDSNEDCVHVYTASGEAKETVPMTWNNDACEPFKKSFFCKVPNQPPKCDPTINVCPSGWSKFCHLGSFCNCYKLIDDPMDYKSAERQCKNHTQGFSLLTSIDSEEEDNFVSELITSQLAWIGFHKHATTGDTTYNYSWSDGSPTNYTNWMMEYPEDPNEMCTLKYTDHQGQWLPSDCSLKAQFVCEQKNHPDEEDAHVCI